MNHKKLEAFGEKFVKENKELFWENKHMVMNKACAGLGEIGSDDFFIEDAWFDGEMMNMVVEDGDFYAVIYFDFDDNPNFIVEVE